MPFVFKTSLLGIRWFGSANGEHWTNVLISNYFASVSDRYVAERLGKQLIF